MTDEELNLWERQPNVCRVLISREMGAWLKRRDENKAKQQPTVCDIERQTGEWKLDMCGVYCSECHGYQDYSTDFCPNCGADMRGVKG